MFSVDSMTKTVHLVSMSRWDYDKIMQVFEEMLGSGDPADPRERKRLKIVRAATELFMLQGYRKTTMMEVAERAGVAKGTLYLYVKNKGELVAQAIGEEKREYLKVLKDILRPETPPRQQLRGWIQVALVSATRMPLMARLMSGDQELLAAMQEMPEQMMQQRAEVGMDFLSDLLDQAAGAHRWTASELQDRSQVLMGMMHFAILLANDKVRGHLSHERFAEILADVMTDGLCQIPANGGKSPQSAEQKQPPKHPRHGEP